MSFNLRKAESFSPWQPFHALPQKPFFTCKWFFSPSSLFRTIHDTEAGKSLLKMFFGPVHTEGGSAGYSSGVTQPSDG